LRLPLGEAKPDGQGHRTRVDVRVDYSGNRTALVEVKFTEPSFGPCGTGHERDDAHLKSACSAGGATLDSLAGSCFLAQHKNRGYFTKLLASDSIVDQAGLEGLGKRECPLRGGLYQIARNLLMVDEVARREHRRTEFIVAAPGRSSNRSLHGLASLYGCSSMEEFLRSVVRPSERDRVRFLDFQQVVTRAAAASGDAANWASYMERKYSAALR
jgi:hypothetical protein